MYTGVYIYMYVYMCICVYIFKKFGLPGYTDSMRIVGKHATIFNIIPLLSILD